MTLVPQIWNGLPLVTAGLPAVDPACCCATTPPPCHDCEVCLESTFCLTTAAVVSFSGSISPGDCPDCSVMVNTEWELPKIGIIPPVPPDPWDTCRYRLDTPLGCNTADGGYDWMSFEWFASGPLTARGSLTMHYVCDLQSAPTDGLWRWDSDDIPWDSTDPTQGVNCLAPLAITNVTNADNGCLAYSPCFFWGMTANIRFLVP